MLKMAIWFAIHTVFRETIPVHQLGLNFDAPKLFQRSPVSTLHLNWYCKRHGTFSDLKSEKKKIIPTLLGSCLAGVLLFVIGVHP